MAGAGGFEPPNGGIKTRCLAAWRRPNNLSMLLHRVAVNSLCDEGLKLARGVTGNLLGYFAFVVRGEYTRAASGHHGGARSDSHSKAVFTGS